MPMSMDARPNPLLVTGSSAPTRLLARRYRVGARIGSGGSADVFIARDTVRDRDVAIKVLHGSLASDPRSLARFDRESEIAAALAHRATVRVEDRGREGDIHFLVMELVRGTSLRTVLRQHAILAPAQVSAIAIEVLGALDVAHRHGLLHRDVKPENVLVSELGEIKVTDFGLVGGGAASDDTGARIDGTAPYVAPELLRGAAADARSDLYAVGVLAAEALTGRMPGAGAASSSGHIPRPSLRNAMVTAPLDDWVVAITDPDPAVRPPSAADAARDLERVARSLPPAPPIGSLVTLPAALRRS